MAYYLFNSFLSFFLHIPRQIIINPKWFTKWPLHILTGLTAKCFQWWAEAPRWLQRWGEAGATAATPLWVKCHRRKYIPPCPFYIAHPPPSRHPQGSKSISHYTELKRLLSSFSSCRHHHRAANGFWILFIVFCHTKEKASETVVNVNVKVI